MKISAAALLVAAGIMAAPDPAEPELEKRAAPGLEAIHPRSLAAHVQFLSDDRLEARGTGTRGQGIAENYVAAAMQAAGLLPAGEDGSFFQEVPLRAWLVNQDTASLILSGPGRPPTKLVRGEDFVALSDGEHSEVEIDAPLVFVGYAVSAPEFGYDDLHGVELKGKFAVVLQGAPLSNRSNYFPPAAHAVYADQTEKLRTLARREAAGVLFVYTPTCERRLPWENRARRSREEGMDWLEGARVGSGVSGVPARGVLSMRGFEKILAAAGVPGGAEGVMEKAESGRLSALALKLRARLRASAEIRELRSRNVAGVLPGSDPARASEFVVMSAHLGYRALRELPDPDPPGDASVAVLLELAKAFTALPVPPRRSVLFLALTGSEQGLLGSQYFTRHPTVPGGQIVADLNLDGSPLGPSPSSVVAYGAEDSSLATAAAAGAEAIGIELSPDPDPLANVLARSDQYTFAREGVPSLFVAPEAGFEARQDRRRALSRTPGTNWDAAWDWQAVARLARLQFLIGLKVADDGGPRPSFNPGDFFEGRGRGVAR